MDDSQTQSVLYQAHQDVMQIMLNTELDNITKTNKILSIIDQVAWQEAERGYDIGYEEAKHRYKLQ